MDSVKIPEVIGNVRGALQEILDWKRELRVMHRRLVQLRVDAASMLAEFATLHDPLMRHNLSLAYQNHELLLSSVHKQTMWTVEKDNLKIVTDFVESASEKVSEVEIEGDHVQQTEANAYQRDELKQLDTHDALNGEAVGNVTSEPENLVISSSCEQGVCNVVDKEQGISNVVDKESSTRKVGEKTSIDSSILCSKDFSGSHGNSLIMETDSHPWEESDDSVFGKEVSAAELSNLL